MRTNRRVLATLTATISAVALAAPVLATSALAGGDHHGARQPRTLVPIGGGYEAPSIEGFSRVAMQGASGPTVDREENLALAQQRTDQVDAICDTVVRAPFTGCTATLAVLLDRADALDPANSQALRSPSTDGIYILGGDQGIAMDVLAESPAETAMTTAFNRGVAVGGTSAGAAVESRSMINGYVGDLGPAEGLRQGSTLMWWGDDADRERGLAFGSQKAIFDQHFYQRGRFGRLLSTVASSDDRYHGRSLLGVGVDYATGIEDQDDSRLTDVFGASSAAVLDFETLRARHWWVGPNHLLSARHVLVHLLTPGAVSYDLHSRSVELAGRTVPDPRVRPWQTPTVKGRATVYLGGDVSGDFTTGAMPDFVRTAKAARGSRNGPMVVIAANAGDTATAQEYAAGVRAAGWSGDVVPVAFGGPGWAGLDLRHAAGVVVVGKDPTTLGQAVSDPVFRSRMAQAVKSTPAVFADRHMAAVLGRSWSPKADPTDDNYEDEGVANFRADDAQFRPGLGLVSLSAVPTLTYDYRWGRLFALGQRDQSQLAVGIGEDTAVVLDGRGASVVGAGSVAALDSRQARYTTAANGAIGAVNTVLDVFAPGERLAAAR